jgi:GT2 family glycosyltransferase
MKSAVPFPTLSSAGSGASRFTCKRPSYRLYAALAVARAAVVIPSWNGAGFLGECLRSLAGQTYPAHIIVVDNGSTDGTLELVRGQFQDVEVQSLPTNRGFAGAVNVGIAHALRSGADYVALLNNDAVAEPDWLASLVACAEQHPEAGIVTSKFLLEDGQHIDSTGDFYSSWGWAYPRGRDEVDRGQYDDPGLREVFCGSGGASLFRARMLEEVGHFDEDYFAYLEDQDLGFRAQLMGWRARYEPRARAYHRMMGTSSRLEHFGRYQAIRNCIFLYVKNMPAPLFWRYLPKFSLGLVLMAVNDLRRRRFRAIAGAYLDAAVHLPRMLARRRAVQASRRVDPRYIDSILVHSLPPTQKTLLRAVSALPWRR